MNDFIVYNSLVIKLSNIYDELKDDEDKELINQLKSKYVNKIIEGFAVNPSQLSSVTYYDASFQSRGVDKAKEKALEFVGSNWGIDSNNVEFHEDSYDQLKKLREDFMFCRAFYSRSAETRELREAMIESYDTMMIESYIRFFSDRFTYKKIFCVKDTSDPEHDENDYYYEMSINKLLP